MHLTLNAWFQARVCTHSLRSMSYHTLRQCSRLTSSSEPSFLLKQLVLTYIRIDQMFLSPELSVDYVQEEPAAIHPAS